MLHIVICGEDRKEMDSYERKIYEIMRQNVRVAKYASLFALLTYVVDEAHGDIDIIMLDLDWKEYDGIEVAKGITEYYPEINIIFMSNMLERVKDIFQITPLYFLVKPLEKKYLENALFKAARIIDEKRASILTLKSKYGKNNWIVFKIRDIYYIESDMRQIHIHEADNYKSVYMKLDEVEKELPGNFCRCHQSYIINMDKVKIISKEEIELFNGSRIPISRSRKNFVIHRLDSYMHSLP